MSDQVPLSLRDSIRALKRAALMTLAISVALALLAYAIAARMPVVREAHFSVSVLLNEREDAADFRYDGYYALSAADLFSDTVAGLLSSPEVIASAYQRAGIVLPSEDARRLARTVRVEKGASRLVRIAVSGDSAAQAESLADALAAVIADEVERYNSAGDGSVSFVMKASDPWIGAKTAAPLPVALAVFLAVFLVLNMIVLFRESFSRGLGS